MKLKLIVFFCFLNSIVFAQTKADLCKKSIISYCKKNYSLYKAVEFSRFEKSYYVYDDYTIDVWLSNLIRKTNELKDTIAINKINKYLLTHSIETYHFSESYFDMLTKIELVQIKGEIFNKFIFKKTDDNIIDSVLINNFITNDEVINMNENGVAQKDISFNPERDKLTKPAFIYVHIYEALTKGGTKRYFSSLFYLDTKTYKVLDEVEL
jgi:hypothetical protein